MTSWPSGYDRLILDEVESTNAEATRIAAKIEAERELALQDGAPHPPHRPMWILAHRQTRGRGRRGRNWSMRPGNLAATLLTFPDCDAKDAALRSFVAALAVADLCSALGGEDITMKWPNDVLLKGRKVAGILLESAAGPEGLRHLVVGIGVNLLPVSGSAAPNSESATLPAISVLEAGGKRTDPEQALAILAGAWDQWERRFVREGFAPVRDAWLARAARLGETIEIRCEVTRNSEVKNGDFDSAICPNLSEPSKTRSKNPLQPCAGTPNGVFRSGVFEDVDATGALVLKTSSGIERVAAADVFFPDEAPCC